jgi:formamidopyrimidine-DNA glycosylase
LPELPEVEAARILVRRVARGRRIARVWCADDPIVFEGRGSARVRRALRGRVVVDVGRHGKHLWLELDRRPWPSFHFGMAGGFAAPSLRRVKLRSSGHREPGPAWPPRFTKLRVVFDDGGEIAMTDGRRLGRIRLRQDPPAESPIRDLGFDALLDLPSPARFAALLGERGSAVRR